MISKDLIVLITTAATVGFLHTVLGPDHYLPFIVMSRSGQWSLRKTTLVTILCGLGHVFSSVLLGMLGIVLGIAVSRLEVVEAYRGSIAAWALIMFGLIYMAWGIRKAIKQKPHQHTHTHSNGIEHVHIHNHAKSHVHIHHDPKSTRMTPWVLFTIFVLGPCEPLIPMLMYPAVQNSLHGLFLVTTIFGGVTIITMLSIVLISTWSIDLIPTSRFERYIHATAGATIFLSGIAIQFLGL